jgi:hypothetical protein
VGTLVTAERGPFCSGLTVAIRAAPGPLDRMLWVDAGPRCVDDGLLVWETGANAGVAYEAKAWTEVGRALEL